MNAPAGHTELAYRRCESITRAAAGNFYYGIRLLPARKRRAMCAVYAWARRIDDIGDGTLAPAEKLRRLEEAEQALRDMRPDDPDPVLAALADASVRFALPADAMTDLIEGVRMDVRGTSYEDFEELELYCRRVAGSIGRLCLAIFGERPAPPGAIAATSPAAGDGAGAPSASAATGGDGSAATEPELVGWAPDKTGRPASELADDLGVALQLANIVRDLREDAEHGRVYLPAKDLVRYHLHDDAALDTPALRALMREACYAERAMVEGFEGGDVGQLYALMRFYCLHARDFFHRGMELVGRLDRRSAACVLAMAGIYWRLLHRIEERPDRALARRTRLRKREKAWVAARALLGKGIPERHPAERLQDDDV